MNNLLCVPHTNALSVQYFILKSSVCSEKRLNSHQYSLKHCSKHASRIERFTFVDDWRSGKNPMSKDSQFYWTCIGWQTHPTRKAESLPRLCYLTTKSKPTFLPHDGLWWRMDVLPRWRGGTNWPELYAERYRKYTPISRKVSRIRCTRQPRKVLWVVLSWLVFNEIWKNARRGRGHVCEC